MTTAQGVELGPFSFTVLRILVAAGVVRILIRGERFTGGMNKLDWLMVIWASCVIISSYFRPEVSDALVYRLGIVYNTCGIYFLIRIFCQTTDGLRDILRTTAILLLPVALEMIYEDIRVYNLFSALGGVPVIPDIREGNIRAQGPFSHAILAGTVGAVCLPLVIGVWSKHRKSALIGIFSCVSMVLCSSSSGPIASTILGIGGLSLWHYRDRMRVVRWVAVIGYLALDLVMKAPAYYLMARVPIVAGSTGWHRARLIESAFEHLGEWWLAGTEYTRHWMPTGVSWNVNHTDITNHYIQIGIYGGLPLMLIFIAILAKGFSYVGQTIRSGIDQPLNEKFMIWAFGSSLFANAATMISVSYFDQSFLFLYLTLGAIGSAWSSAKPSQVQGEKDNLSRLSGSSGALLSNPSA